MNEQSSGIASQLRNGSANMDRMNKEIRSTLMILYGAVRDITHDARWLLMRCQCNGMTYSCDQTMVVWIVDLSKGNVNFNAYSKETEGAGRLMMGIQGKVSKLLPSIDDITRVHGSLDALVEGVLRDFPAAKGILDPILEAGK